MTAPAIDVLREVSAAGGTVRLRGDMLRLSAAGPLPDELRARLRQHKAEIVALLSAAEPTNAAAPEGPAVRSVIAWLDGKMATFGNGKLLPPAAVLTTDLSGVLEHRLHRRITEQILREARIDERVAAALQEIALPLSEGLRTAVDDALTDQPAASWRAAIARIADQLLAAQGGLQECGT